MLEEGTGEGRGEGRGREGSQRGGGHCLLGREGRSLEERDWKGPKRREKPLETPGRCSSSLHEGSRERTTREFVWTQSSSPPRFRQTDIQCIEILRNRCGVCVEGGGVCKAHFSCLTLVLPGLQI